MSGFTYCGVHSGKYSVEYIPDPKARWDASPEFDVYEEDVAGRDGGYYYGNNTKIRKITLQCFFENIPMETREDIRSWLGRNTKGKLIFDDKPFVYYNVRPSKIVDGEIYTILTGRGEIHSGTFTVTFSAYEPYGFMTYKQIDDGVDLKGAEIYSGILPAEQMPALISETSTSGLIYNCGTQPCNTLIQIGGTGTDIVISNETNGTFCSLLSLPESGYLEIDSRLGKVTWVHNEQRDVFFEYHNEGYLTLAPYLPKQFNVGVEYKKGSATVSFYGLTSLENYLGKYIYLEDAWHKIVSVSEEDGTAELDTAITANGATLTKIVTMNEIKITGTGMTLNKLSIDYTPVIV